MERQKFREHNEKLTSVCKRLGKEIQQFGSSNKNDSTALLKLKLEQQLNEELREQIGKWRARYTELASGKAECHAEKVTVTEYIKNQERGQYKKQIRRLNEQVSKLGDMNTNLNLEVRELKKNIERLEEKGKEADLYEQQLIDYENKLALISQEMMRLHQKIKIKQSSIEDLKKTQDNLNTSIASIRIQAQQCQRLQLIQQKCQKQLQLWKFKYNNLENQKAQLQSINKELQQRNSIEESNQNNHIQIALNQIQFIRNINNNLQIQIHTLCNQIKLKMQQFAELKIIIQTLQSKNQQQSILKEKLENNLQEKEQLFEQLEQAHDERHQLYQEILRLEAQANQAKNTLIVLNRQLQDTARSNQQLEQCRAEMNAYRQQILQYQNLAAQYEQLQSKANRFQSKAIKLQRNCEQLKKKLQSVNQQQKVFYQQKQEIEMLRSQAEQATAIINHLNERIKAIETILTTFKVSIAHQQQFLIVDKEKWVQTEQQLQQMVVELQKLSVKYIQILQEKQRYQQQSPVYVNLEVQGSRVRVIDNNRVAANREQIERQNSVNNKLKDWREEKVLRDEDFKEMKEFNKFHQERNIMDMGGKRVQSIYQNQVKKQVANKMESINKNIIEGIDRNDGVAISTVQTIPQVPTLTRTRVLGGILRPNSMDIKIHTSPSSNSYRSHHGGTETIIIPARSGSTTLRNDMKGQMVSPNGHLMVCNPIKVNWV